MVRGLRACFGPQDMRGCPGRTWRPRGICCSPAGPEGHHGLFEKHGETARGVEIGLLAFHADLQNFRRLLFAMMDRRLIENFDWSIIWALLAIISIGLLSIYSALYHQIQTR